MERQTQRAGTYWVPLDQARNFAEALAYRVGQLALLLDGGNSTPGRIVTGYRVDAYGIERDAYGVVERWRYSDRPDLPEFGGQFVPVSMLVLMAGAAPRCLTCRRLLIAADDLTACRACESAAGASATHVAIEELKPPN